MRFSQAILPVVLVLILMVPAAASEDALGVLILTNSHGEIAGSLDGIMSIRSYRTTVSLEGQTGVTEFDCASLTLIERGSDSEFEVEVTSEVREDRGFILFGDDSNIEPYILTPKVEQGFEIALPAVEPLGPDVSLPSVEPGRVLELVEVEDEVCALGTQQIEAVFGSGFFTASLVPDRSNYLFNIGYTGGLLLYAVTDDDGAAAEEISMEVEEGDIIVFDDDGAPILHLREADVEAEAGEPAQEDDTEAEQNGAIPRGPNETD